MLLHPISDLHVDKEGNAFKRAVPLDRDVVVLIAGDWGEPGTAYMPLMREIFPDNRIVAHAGNHDFYSEGNPKADPRFKTTWQRERDLAPKIAASLGIDWLDGGYSNGEIVIDGVRILGGTSWTDFQARPNYIMPGDAARMAASSSGMRDYRKIKVDPGKSRHNLTPAHTIQDHKLFRRWLEGALATPFDGDTIVSTHHAPSWQSLQTPGKPGSDLDWCYASDLERLMHWPDETNGLAPSHVPPSFWFHGHIHRNQDYSIGGTRVIANPRGYPAGPVWREGGPRENPDFDPQLVIEIGRDLTPTMGM